MLRWNLCPFGTSNDVQASASSQIVKCFPLGLLDTWWGPSYPLHTAGFKSKSKIPEGQLRAMQHLYVQQQTHRSRQTTKFPAAEETKQGHCWATTCFTEGQSFQLLSSSSRHTTDPEAPKICVCHQSKELRPQTSASYLDGSQLLGLFLCSWVSSAERHRVHHEAVQPVVSVVWSLTACSLQWCRSFTFMRVFVHLPSQRSGGSSSCASVPLALHLLIRLFNEFTVADYHFIACASQYSPHFLILLFSYWYPVKFKYTFRSMKTLELYCLKSVKVSRVFLRRRIYRCVSIDGWHSVNWIILGLSVK